MKNPQELNLKEMNQVVGGMINPLGPISLPMPRPVPFPRPIPVPKPQIPEKG